jgi:multicomponent Na+:H+ antiporter subunit E
VVEARRSTHTLFLHVLDVGDEAGVEAFRDQVFALERRVVLALGADTTPVAQVTWQEPRRGGTAP